MSSILSNNNYYNMSAKSLKLNGVDVQSELDNLQNEIDNITPGNPNALVSDTPLIIPTAGSVFISDGVSSTGTNASEDLIIRNYGVIDVQSQLNCNGGLNIQSLTTLPVNLIAGETSFNINNTAGTETKFLNSSSYLFDNNIISNENVILNQGKSLTLNNDTDADNVKLYKQNGALGNFVLDNQTGSKTEFKNASEYYFDNNVNIGDLSTSKTLSLNGVPITPSSGGVSTGMLRALNINQLVPTVAQTYDIVWSNLTPAEQAIWAGGSEPPVASATGNYWSFVKSAPSTNKINWTLPIDLSALTFQDMQSVWAIVRFNNGTNVNAEGQLWFQIQSQNIVPNPPLYRTRWNYSNSATPINQFQYFYKIHALDTITTTNSANLGKGQEVGQQKFKGNPCDVESNLWSIGFNKLVLSPTGDTTAGYTLAPVQSVALNTASNIHTYNFDVVAIGVNNYRFNLFYA